MYKSDYQKESPPITNSGQQNSNKKNEEIALWWASCAKVTKAL
mgnify:CR=1 FL=1